MKEKLERKEYFMQTKEKKWLEVEKILEEYCEEDEELRDKLYELRVNVHSNKKISNVVVENEKLKFELNYTHDEITRLRKHMLGIVGDKGNSLSMMSSSKTPKGSRGKPSLSNNGEDGDEDECGELGYIESQGFNNKKSFMSTAPINIKGIMNRQHQKQMKIKESKEELKEYNRKLEEALANVQQKYMEIEKDHEIINKTYMRELKKGDKMQ